MKTFLMPLALGLSLWILSRVAYTNFTPGIPDSGMLPSAAVPLAFPLYGSVRLWSSFGMFIVWLLCCSLFILPQLVAFTLATTQREFAWFVTITITEWLLCAWLLWSLGYSDYDYRFGFATVTIAALLSIGVAFGQLFHRANDKTRNA